jgi:hypothetical protein
MFKKILMTAFVCAGMTAAMAATPKARARIDLSGIKVKITPEAGKNGISASNPGWIKDAEKKAYYITSQSGVLSSEKWTEYEMTFTPESDGRVDINLMSNYYYGKDESGKSQIMPFWVQWDDVVVTGATLVNGDFEQETAKGTPTGWSTKKDNYIKQDGQKYVKAWHNSRASQKITVTKGQKVTITAKTRSAE